jgi:hypothetical protein
MRSVRRWSKRRPAYQRLSVLWENREYYFVKAEEDFRKSRPPEGAVLELKSVRMMELFHMEDLGRLQDGVLKLFPGIEKDPNARPTIESFLIDAPESFVWDYPWKLGHVAPRRRFMHFPYREMRDLPKEVYYVGVEVVQLTASFFALCLDVHLTADAMGRVNELQSGKYVTKAEWRDAVKWALRLSRSLEFQPPSVQRQRAVLGYLQGLRGDVARRFAPYFGGHFQQNEALGLSSKLPAIEAYVLSGVPQEKERLSKFIDDAREWWRSCGFEFIFDSYISRSPVPSESENILEVFFWAKYSRSSLTAPHRVIILEDTLLSSIDTSRDPRGKDAIIDEHIESYVMALTPAVVLWQLLLVMGRRVSRLNHTALKLMRVRWWTWFRPKIRQNIKLNNDIQRESMLLDRLNVEWGRKVKELEWPIKAGEWKPLERMNSVLHERVGKPASLKELAVEEIGDRIEDLDQQLSHLRNWHGQHLLNKNAWVTFGLALIVLFATIIGLIQIAPILKNLLWPAPTK